MRNTLIAVGALLVAVLLVFGACTKPAEFQVVSLDVDLPPKRSPVMMLVKWDNKGGTNGQEKSIIKNR